MEKYEVRIEKLCRMLIRAEGTVFEHYELAFLDIQLEMMNVLQQASTALH